MHTCISSHGLKRSWRSCPRRVNAGKKNTPSTHHPRRRNVTTLMVGLKKKKKKKVTYAKISPKSGEPQRYSWGTQKKNKKTKKKPLGFTILLILRFQLYLRAHQSSSPPAFPAMSVGITILGELFTYMTIILFSHKGSHISSSWMVHAWCVIVAGIHPSRTWMSGSFESARWNASAHRLDLALYSYCEEFWGDGVRTHVNSQGKKYSLPDVQRRIEPTTLFQAGQRAQHTTDRTLPAPS